MKKGIIVFGKQGKYAALKEIKKLHDRVVFEPIYRNELNERENKRSMESLIYLL